MNVVVKMSMLTVRAPVCFQNRLWKITSESINCFQASHIHMLCINRHSTETSIYFGFEMVNSQSHSSGMWL